MAIDRTKAYYKEWVNDVGWNMRFEIIPAGESVDAGANIDAITYVPVNHGMIKIKSQKASFDKIPFGVRDATSLEVEFDFTDLQSNLKEMLKKPFYDHASEGIDCITTNIFVLKSDRGTNGASSFIEFCGGQKATLANQFTLSKNPETGAFETKGCTVEAIDIMKLILEQTSTQAWADYILANPTDTYLKSVGGAIYLHDWALNVHPYNTKYDYNKVNLGIGSSYFSATAHLYVGAYLFTYGLMGVVTPFLAAWTRNNIAQYVANIDGTPFEQITYYKQGTTIARTKGSAISSSNLLVVGKVPLLDTTAGMLYPDAGGESYLEFPYLWDLLKNLCEGNCCKLTYKPLMIADGLAVDRLSYSLRYDKLFANPSGLSIDLSTRFADAHTGDLDFTPCSGVYTSATTELTNQRDPDINNFEAVVTGTQSDERINVKLVHHNLPTSNLDGNRQMREPRLHLRKLYYLNAENYPIKVHESVTIDDALDSTLYDDVLPLPALAATSGNYESEQRVRECTDWAIATPLQNGLPFAVSNFYLSRFSDATQNEIPVKMFMINEETMPENCGDICTIPVIDGFDSSTSAVMLEMDCNWQKGTVDITFFTRGV